MLELRALLGATLLKRNVVVDQFLNVMQNLSIPPVGSRCHLSQYMISWLAIIYRRWLRMKHEWHGQ